MINFKLILPFSVSLAKLLEPHEALKRKGGRQKGFCGASKCL